MVARLRLLPAARLLASPLSLALLVALVSILGIAVVRATAQRIAVATAVSRTQREIAQLTAEQERLSTLVARLGSPQALESDARLRLNLARPGETLTVLPEPDAARAAAAVSDTNARTGPERWFRYLFAPEP